MPRPSSRDAILDAVERVVAERGAAHLTLDAIAAECGLSKGGLIYHFPTKEALLHAMLARFIDGRQEQRRRACDALGRAGEPPNSLKAEIIATLEPPGPESRSSANLLAVVANDPSLLDGFREGFQTRFREVTASATDADDAAILFFAALGLHFHDILQIKLTTARERDRIRARLLEMADRITPANAARPDAGGDAKPPRKSRRSR